MELGVRFFGFIQLLMRLVSWPLAWMRRQQRPAPALPPIGDPLLQLSVSELANRIRTGKVTSEAVVSAFVARAREVNPFLNAVVQDRFEEAIQEARAVDAAIADGSAPDVLAAPLLGVPVTIKESCRVKGMSHVVGSLARKGAVADADGAAVASIRAAGAIPLCVTTTPELCVSWETDNLVTGVTCNPFDLRRSPGGSSGGEAALISAGASPLGVGSDIAGSIRVPAHFVGIFGHKPTAGYVPLEGHEPLGDDPIYRQSLVIGPMARYANDLRVGLAALAGPSAKALRLFDPVDLSGLKVFFMEDAGFSLVALSVDREIKQRLRQAVKFLKDRFKAPVQKDAFPEMADSLEMSVSVFYSMNDIPDLLQNPNDPKKRYSLLGELLRCAVGAARVSFAGLGFTALHRTNVFIPRSRTPFYKAQRDALRQKFIDVLGENGVFIYPTFPRNAGFHREIYMKMSGVMYPIVFNLLDLPSTHVPLGLDSQGMPIGVQIAAAPHNDRLCLAVAEELERGFGGWVPPPATNASAC